jgi:hypothetical protein
MARSYDAADIVQLPKLSASGAIALGASLITTAKAETLAGSVEKAFSRLKKTHAALRQAAQGRLVPGVAEDSPDIRAADRDLDAAWSATYDWATGWAKLPGKGNAPRAALARTLLQALFADGLKFTQLRYKLEWAESQTRLDVIEQEHLDESFDALGGGAFLDALKAAHKVYGDLLGLTKTTAPEAPAGDVRQPLDAFHAALRTYVVAVTASADEDDADSVEVAQKLLAPLAAWESAPQEAKAEAKANPELEAAAPKPKELKG